MQVLDMRNPCDPLQKRKIIKQRRDYTPEQVKQIAWHVFNPPMRQVVCLEGLSGREKQAEALKASQAKSEHEGLIELCNYRASGMMCVFRPSIVTGIASGFLARCVVSGARPRISSTGSHPWFVAVYAYQKSWLSNPPPRQTRSKQIFGALGKGYRSTRSWSCMS
jgi:hypothetical protein